MTDCRNKTVTVCGVVISAIGIAASFVVRKIQLNADVLTVPVDLLLRIFFYIPFFVCLFRMLIGFKPFTKRTETDITLIALVVVAINISLADGDFLLSSAAISITALLSGTVLIVLDKFIRTNGRIGGNTLNHKRTCSRST